MSYTYLNHVNTEFIADEEQVGEEADEMLKQFFHSRIATKSRAIQGDGLRYVITSNGKDPQIIEEDGDWQSGDYSVSSGNDYELIYEEKEGVEREEITASEAAEHFGTAEL